MSQMIAFSHRCHHQYIGGICGAVALEFTERDIPFHAEVRLPIRFKDRILRTHFRADFLSVL